jgi:succinyl-diaminopimelate desuccinylase
MKKILKELLRFRSTAENNSELHKIVDYVEQYFNDFNVHTKRFIKNDKPSIVITSKYTTSPKILFNGHLDVVPAKEKDFEPYEKDGKIFARGSSDMKGVVAAMVQAFVELIENNDGYDLGLMLTTDEEVGGFDGTGYLVKEQGYTSEIVFLPDGYEGNWSICTDEKGIWWIEIEAEGKEAHGSRPWMGENAIEKLMNCVLELKASYEEEWGIPTESDDWKPSFNIGLIEGGHAANSVPTYAKVKIDMRFPDYVDQMRVMSLIKSVTEKHAVKFQKLISAEPTHISDDNKYLINWKEVFRGEFGKNTSTYRTHGASDGRFFAEIGVPVLSVKPDCSPPHVEDEWVHIGQLEKYKDMIVSWVSNSYSA